MSRPAFVFTRALRTATARRAAVVALGAGAVGAYTLGAYCNMKRSETVLVAHFLIA